MIALVTTHYFLHLTMYSEVNLRDNFLLNGDSSVNKTLWNGWNGKFYAMYIYFYHFCYDKNTPKSWKENVLGDFGLQ